ncbi:hypothetical protein CIG75_02685 [Tumebacillus algifaecis]|uniref:Phenolphthiocerol/phthiocerol polyketide synthase subunit E n=1 Tax=Tumebacillus algifaecis TaxID=1214604 RepID=A0A223CXS1_9BACL|nr:non-ribosomal peptide synthetase [Tumebacillus algifaecis]ASS73994.1 hypothetical protein CIG75_02685 [Tumebacillus algifaecis]
MMTQNQRLAISHGREYAVADGFPSTLVEAVQQSAALTPNKGVFHIKADGSESFQSYADLLQEAEQVLAGLRAHGGQAGDKVMIELNDSRAFLAVFWGCLLGGMVAVPLHVPAAFTPDAEDFRKTKNVWELLDRPLLVVESHLADKYDKLKETDVFAELRTVTADDLLANEADRAHYQPKQSDLAFIQFSSGSTGTPKGVQLTHENLVCNVWQIAEGTGIDERDTYVSWMPYFHDMGLIGLHLVPLFIRINQCKMSPETFIRKPDLLLKKITEHGGTVTGSPNFGLEWMTSKIKDRDLKEIDLSSLRILYNGAEPISITTAEQFMQRFAPCGFRRQAMYYVYGMAEGCVGVTIPPKHSDPLVHEVDQETFTTSGIVQAVESEDAKRLLIADEGYPVVGMSLRIVDDADQVLPEGHVGHIQMKGPNVTQGYYKLPEVNATLFADGYLRTGDLGFIKDGRLTITGRNKDIIFINGQNFYAHDIESLVTRRTDAELGGAIACGLTDPATGREQVLIFVKFKRKLQDFLALHQAIKTTINSELGFEIHAAIPVPAVPKTTSGKLARFKMREQYQQGAFDSLLQEIDQLLALQAETRIDIVLPQTETERNLHDIWARLLNRPAEQISIHDHFMELGGNSLSAIQLLRELESWFGYEGFDLTQLFEYQTIAQLAAYIEHLKTEIGGRFEVAATSTRDRLLVTPLTEQDDYDLARAQNGLWFDQQMNPAQTVYNEHFAFHMHGDVNLAALEQALHTVTARHQALRTVFIEQDGVPKQVVLADSAVLLPVYDLSSLAPEAQQAQLAHAVDEEVCKPFDLQNGPLVRYQLHKLGATDYHFHIVGHHIVLDGMSFSVLFQEVSALYSASVEGKTADLPQLPVQFVDFAAWQNRILQEAKGAELEAYWLNRLVKPLPSVDLPSDHLRPEVQHYRGAVAHFPFSAERIDQLRALCKQHKVSLNMLMLAAYFTFLHRLTQEEDIIIGAPLSGRTTPEVENLIGNFVNVMPIRVSFAGINSFSDLLQQVKTRVLEALNYQGYPFDLLVEKLNPNRELGRPILFSSVFNMQPVPSVKLSNLKVEYAEMTKHTSLVDQAWLLKEYDERLVLTIEYNTDLFKRESVERFAAQYAQVVATVADNLQAEIQAFDLLTDADLAVYQASNDTFVDYDMERTVLESFVQVAEAEPERVAVIDGERTMTYGELHERSNRLAHYLREQGVSRNQLVGVLMERSAEVYVGIYAILKAGAAYVPIDPDYPEWRIEYMLADSSASVVLIKEQCLSILNGLKERGSLASIVVLDREEAIFDAVAGQIVRTWSDIAAYSEQMPAWINDPSDLAYMIYTSGSTGNPKGVKVAHRSLLNSLYYTGSMLGFGKSDVIAQKTSICFDPSIYEIILPQFCGASAVIIPNEVAKDPYRLHQSFQAHRVSFSILVPSLLTEFVYALEAMEEHERALPHLRWVMPGGEALPVRTVNRWFELLGADASKIAHEYGPTEATIGVITSVFEGKQERIVLGKPIANVQIYILDETGRICPVGVAGELVIGGIQVAEGYHNLPEKTAEVFIPNHLPGTPGDRLYRSGDLARLLADGTIEYLGRIDNQVKVRGFRIELGEVEEALGLHEQVGEAAVIAIASASGDKQLAAYFTSRHDELTASDLRNHLQKKLPAYMVPSYFVRMDKMPLSPNGKIDRKSLPSVSDVDRLELLDDYIAPQTATEIWTANLWAEILQIDRVGLTHNFFDLGGHSLMVTRIVSRIKKQYGLQVVVRDLFDHPTLREFAAHLDQLLTGSAVASMQEIVAIGKQEAYELSNEQKRLWFLYKLEPESTFYNMSGTMIFKGPMDIAAFEAALQKTVERHAILRTRFIERDGIPLQVVQDDVSVTLPFYDLTELEETQRLEQLEAMIGADRQHAFDLAQAPLLRTMMIKVGEQEHHFYLNMHHITSDGWSTGIFAKEISDLYYALSHGKDAELAPLDIQYVDYAAWQNDQLQSGQFDEQEHYWLNTLSKPLPVLNLPTDFTRPERQSLRGSESRWQIDKALYAQVTELANKLDATPFMVLLSSYVLMLHRLSGDQDIIVGTPVAGRTSDTLESLIGCFLNTLSIRTKFDGVATFRDLLSQIKERTLEAYEHQAYPFDLLVEKVNPERDMSRSAIFSTMFVLQNMPFELHFSDLEVSLEEEKRSTSKFDLTVYAMENQAGLELTFVYGTDLFKLETIESMAEQFQNILAEVSVNVDSNLYAVNLHTVKQRAMLRELNILPSEEERVTTSALVEVPFIHRVFELQAEQTPDLTAISHHERQVTYRELNERANQLAHYLRDKGIGRGQRVAIMVNRSVAMLESILGILKSGAAFVPLDPNYPLERLEMILSEVEPTWIISQASYAPKLSDLLTAVGAADSQHLLFVDRPVAGEWTAHAFAEIESFATRNPELISDPDDNNYIYYTSGSTGRPKGVMGRHRSLVQFVRWEIETFAIGAGDRVSQFAALTFDPALRDIFVPLCSGGTVCLPDQETILDREDMVKWLMNQDISVIHCVPSLFRQILAEAQHLDPARRAELFPHLRYIFLGGEALEVKYVKQWRDIFGERIQLVNFYGPTETTMVKLFNVVNELPTEGKVIPIGKGIEAATALLLNQEQALCAVGEIGEIYIRTPYLSLGYFKNPELTAEVFVKNPLDPLDPVLVYRTGDLGRYLADGRVQYVGRKDFQIKVRGFRVELSEIEAALSTFQGMQEVAVVARENADGDHQVIACFTGDDNLSLDEIQTYLKRKLPEYMVPSQINWLEKMPLNPNGKIDRKALRETSVASKQLVSQAYVAPVTATEQQLAAIWSTVLGVEQIGRADNFFGIGGHSLLAMQVLARIKEATHANVKLKDLFAYPTVQELAACIDSLLSAGETEAEATIRPLPAQASYELSRVQQRTWFLYRLEPENVAYSIPQSVTMKGAVNRQAFEQALQLMIERHATLRTVFVEHEDLARQVIRDTIDFALPFFDLRELEDSERTHKLEAAMSEDALTPFDLTQGPLLRAMLFQVADEEYRFYLNMHHIISDGWSMGVFVREFAEFYAALSTGQNIEKEALPIQYVSYAAWQNEQLESGALDSEEQYWLQTLAKPLPVLELPLDSERPALQTYEGRSLRWQLDADLLKRTHALAEREDTSLFMVLLAAYNLLLHRLTGDDDIIVGTPIAGRTNSTLESLIGYFVNTLAIRTRFEGMSNFHELLQQVKQRSLEAFEHQSYPFDLLTEKINPERDRSRSPIFSAMFTLHNAPLDLQFPGLDVAIDEFERGTSKFDMELVVVEHEHGLDLTYEYNTGLLREETVRNWAEQYEMVLKAVLDDAEQHLYNINIMTERDHQILAGVNNTDVDFDLNQLLHEAFVKQAEADPDRIALIDGDRTLTYREMNERSNRLAHFLRAQGVQRNQLVGIQMERSIELLVGMYGILKAGGAYVPIDPEYPAQRVQYMMTNSGADVLLTKQEYTEQIKEIAEGIDLKCVLYMDVEGDIEPVREGVPTHSWSALDTYPAHLPEKVNEPSDIAYTIYTSGSTGKPKGVVIRHSAIINRLHWHQSVFEATPEDCMIQRTTHCFDDSIIELFWPLRHGAKLLILQRNVYATPELLVEQMLEYDVTYMQFVPALFSIFVAYLQSLPEAERPQLKLRNFIVSGEALPTKLVNQWFEMYPNGSRIGNLYGPTEAAVDVTAFLIEGPIAYVHIGGPISNTQCYVVDRHGNLCPTGVKGELLVGGVQLAEGYHNQPEKTAEAFIPNHLPGTPGDRLYRTGDLARILADGTIDYLGRIDNQVKVRGFRIELGEIEEVFSQHPDVEMAIVVVKKAADGNNMLFGFYTSQCDDLEQFELKEFIGQQLTEYMVPTRIVRLPEMPLTPNGKVDRKALEQLAASDDFEEAREFVEPSTALERTLADIWASVLNREAVSATDNFFDLGGHSLLAIQVLNRIRKELATSMELKDLFAYTTVQDLAAHIDRQLAAGQTTAHTEIAKAPEQEHYRLSHAQNRLWFLYKLNPTSTVYNMPMHAKLSGPLDLAAFEQALQILIERHDSLRTVFREVDGLPRQVVLPTSDFRLVYEDLSDRAAAEQQAFVQASIDESGALPFNLGTGPLMRVMLFKLGAQEAQLYFNMHHIIFDGWSSGVFLREFSDLYRTLHAGAQPSLAPLSIQYTDYAEWQAEGMETERFRESESYWLEQLAKPLPTLDLPTDFPRPDVMTHSGNAVWTRVPKELTEQLRALTKQEDVSSFMLMLSAYTMLLHNLTHQDDLIVGTPIAGRTVESLEPLIGFFVNTLAIRVRFDEVGTLKDLLGQVKQQSLDAYQHESYPFDLLIEKLNPERDTSRSPVFSTMFVYNKEGDGAQDIAGGEGLHLQALTDASEHTVSKFDLTVSMNEGDEDIQVRFEYNTDLFRESTIQHFAASLVQTLQAFATALNDPIGSLDLLSEIDRAVYAKLNDTALQAPTDRTIHELFYEVVARQPERIALSDDRVQLTYRELNERSNQVAHLLRGLGVKANDNVAILMERGIEPIIAMLGVLKAGGAFVPIDPDYPEERKGYMLQDSAAQLILTQRSLGEQMSTGDVQTLFIEEIPADTSTSDLASINTAQDLAYIIFTSGSTGLPKGTMLRHVGVPNLAQWKHEHFDYNERDTVLQFASLSFDASVAEIFPALLNGARLHVASSGARQSYEEFANMIATVGVTIAELPTVFFKLLSTYLTDEHVGKLKSLQTIFVAGEALQGEVVRAWHRRFGTDITIINAYGPTEATVSATANAIVGALPSDQANISIGRPMSNVQIYIVDRNLKLCPVNVVGEICIQSVGLAKGYLNQPEKTAEVFVPNPFSDEPGALLYKTGDLARLLPNGTIEFVGRNDAQVKIRGYRIEIGEIEDVLIKYPSIEVAAVLPKKDSDGNQILVAYYTTTTATAEMGDVKSFLAEKLPNYMLPSAYHNLDSMPLSPNGKVDRKALAKLAEQAAHAEQTYEAPATSLEETIVTIWASVLQVEPQSIGIHDNFFDIGGHSLLLAKVHTELKQIGIDIPLTDLFKFPTVKMLADALAASQPEEKKKPTPGRRAKVQTDEAEGVAIIGMALRFPDAKNPYEYWENLRTGHESLREFPIEELEPTPFTMDPEIREQLVRVAGLLDNIDMFQPDFFQITEKEATLMDPQHRLFLECAWEAIENAGYNVDTIDQPVSVYGGAGSNMYIPPNISVESFSRADLFQASLASQPKFMTTRVSYKLNLKGESMYLDTACSTSLVAVHMACQSLLQGQSDYALAGGVSIQMPQKKGYIYEPGFISSPDGRCRAFDKDANGTAVGSGVGVVFLKRLSDAVRDGDPIYAVLKGSAINNDGNLKIGYTAPSQQGQTEVVMKALENAGLSPDDISYIEAHGTGTNLGDPIEVAALTEAFRAGTERKQYCGLGSVKTNMGHLDAAAGVAGLIKVALALKNRELPPSLHFHEPNPAIDFDNSPFYVNTKLKKWTSENGKLRAGVSSFGIGGTNAHVILEEAPTDEE